MGTSWKDSDWMRHLQAESRVLSLPPPILSYFCVEFLKNLQQKQKPQLQWQYLRLWSYERRISSQCLNRETPSDTISCHNQLSDINAHLAQFSAVTLSVFGEKLVITKSLISSLVFLRYNIHFMKWTSSMPRDALFSSEGNWKFLVTNLTAHPRIVIQY